MKNSYCLSFLYALALMLLAGEAFSNPKYAFTSTPDWVLKNAYVAREESALNSTSFILSDHQAKTFDEPTYFYRSVSRINSVAGLDQHSQIHVTFNPEYQVVEFHEFLIQRGGEQIVVPESQLTIRELAQEDDIDRNIHSGLKTLVVIINNIRVGDVIDYSFSIKGSNPIFEGRVFGWVNMGWGVEVDRVYKRILTDKKLNFKSQHTNESFTRKQIGDQFEYVLDVKNLPAYLNEQNYPFGYSAFPYIEYSEFDSWKGVAEWAQGLYPGDEKLPDELQKLIADIQARFPDKQQQVSQVLKYVQDEIRYVSLSLGVNSHKPHSLIEILENGYGDCKDKAHLLQALLKQLDINAYPALVSMGTRSGIFNSLSAPNAFDHVIVYVDDRKFGQYWLDGTRTFQSSPLEKIGKDDFGYALVIKKGESKLTKMYKKQPVQYEVAVYEDFHAEALDAPVKLKTRLVFSNNSAESQRYRFSISPIQEIARQLEGYYIEHYPSAKLVGDVTYEDQVEDNNFVVSAEYEIPKYFIKEGRKITAPVIVGYYKNYLISPQFVNRKGPFFIGPSANLKTSTKVYLPKNSNIRDFESVEDVEHQLFDFESTSHYSNGLLTLNTNLLLNENVLDPEDMNSYTEAVDKVYDALHFGMFFFEQNEVQSGSFESLEELKAAAKSGDPDAQASLGRMYFSGEEGLKPNPKKGFSLLSKSAKQGHTLGQFYLASAYYFGEGVKQDFDEAFLWYEKAAMNNHEASQYYLGKMYLYGQSVKKDEYKAFNWYESSAMAGHINAKVMLGYLYQKGIGTEQSYADSIKWFQEASDEGDARASYYLAAMYMEGEGVSKDVDKALALFQTSADGGDIYAQFRIAQMYFYGENFEQSYTEAFKWFSRSAENGHPYAPAELAFQYLKGLGVEQSYELAFKNYELAANSGHFDAIYNVGHMYHFGLGTKKNARKSKEWFRKSKQAFEEYGNQDSAHRQFSYAKLFYFGYGVERDYMTARIWLSKAANQNHDEAQRLLGDMYRYGFGVNKNSEAAKSWYEKSAKNGNAKAATALEEIK